MNPMQLRLFPSNYVFKVSNFNENSTAKQVPGRRFVVYINNRRKIRYEEKITELVKILSPWEEGLA